MRGIKASVWPLVYFGSHRAPALLGYTSSTRKGSSSLRPYIIC